eukprot:s3662_g3.t1
MPWRCLDRCGPVWTTRQALLVQLDTGECLAWGDATLGGELSDAHKAQLEKGVKSVWSNDFAFLAQLDTGECLAWGDSEYGGELSDENKAKLEKGIKSVWSTSEAFLAQLHTGECVAWGDPKNGGKLSNANRAKLEKGGIKSVWSNGCAFLAQLDTGECMAWGGSTSGGRLSVSYKAKLEQGINSVWNTEGAFLVQLHTGECVAWGDPKYGGKPSDENKAKLEKGIKSVWSTGAAFLAQLHTGECLAWGDSNYGGELSDEHKAKLEKGIKSVRSNDYAFLAQLDTGECLAWGDSYCGGKLSDAYKAKLEKGIQRVWNTTDCLLVQLKTGECLTWGQVSGFDTQVQQALLEKGIKSVWSTGHAFLAQLGTGECLAWGNPSFGGHPSESQKALLTKPGLRVKGFRLSEAQKNWLGKRLAKGLRASAAGSPPAAVKSLRDFDLSPAAVRLQEDLSLVSCSLHRASVKLSEAEVPAIVKTARLAESEMGKIKDRLLWIKKEVQHEHLVRILGLYWGKPNGVLCMVMEPAPRCLRRLIQEEPLLAQKQQLPLAHGITSAMAHLHGLLEPLIHQELKPENVLIFESGSGLLAKVTDVGFNKAIFGHGPLAYKAPELFDGKPCSMASDVYAFAILGWELLCAQEAWAGYTDLCKLKAICVENQRPSMDEEASKSRLGKLIQEAWAQDPVHRPSFETLREKLSQPSIPKQLPKEVPSYWSGQDLDQGWIAVPVAEEIFQKLSALFVVTQPRELGTGRDAASYSRAYSNLKLWCAWRIEHQSLWDKYVAERNDVVRHLRQLERSSIETPQWRSKLEDATVGMPDELCAPIGERYLLHGTKPEVLLDILHQGFNDKLAIPEEEPRLRDHDSDFQVFVNEDRRELSAVPGSDPRIPYHTLVVQTGKEAKKRIERFLEVISFSANRAYPEYLLAYQRV